MEANINPFLINNPEVKLFGNNFEVNQNNMRQNPFLLPSQNFGDNNSGKGLFGNLSNN